MLRAITCCDGLGLCFVIIVFQVLALLEQNSKRRGGSASSRSGTASAPDSSHFAFGHSFLLPSQDVHLLPIPSDAGCKRHFGCVSSTLRHPHSLDFSCVTAALNKKLPFPRQPASQGGSARPQLRHPGHQQRDPNAEIFDNPEIRAQRIEILPVRVQLAEAQIAHADDGADLKGRGLRFIPAVPLPHFGARKKAESAFGAADAVRENFKNMTKCQKQKAKLRLKLARAELEQFPVFLSPGDIPRARLFLCRRSDVQDDSQLPPLHMEIDPLRPLVQSIADFDAKFQSAPPPALRPEKKKAQRRPEPPHGNSAERSNQPFAIFYGSGEDFTQCCIPDELQWSVASLASEIQNGCVSVLDVVAAIKNAMPQSWLAGHGMTEDCLSVAFSKSQQDILDVYTAALHAWGAADVLQPVGRLEDVLRGAVDDEARHGSAAAWQVMQLFIFCSFFDDVDNRRMAKKLFSHTRCSGKMVAAGSRTSQSTFHRLKQHTISS
jgi:hypothetical protein